MIRNFDYSLPERSSSFPKDLNNNPLSASAAVRPMAVRACTNGILNAVDIAIEITTPTATRGNQMRINLENVIFILKITPLSLYMMGLQ
ncbi:MAG: hypothetical protein WCF14_02130 [Nitrososphaeraceae archaeon]